MKTPKDSVLGTVTEILPDLKARVELENGDTVICYQAGKIKKNKIRICIGDKVYVVLDPYKGHATNRIVWRI